MKGIRVDYSICIEQRYPSIPGKCSWPTCGNDLPKGRRRWCSDECGYAAHVEHNVLRGDPAVIRGQVYRRDHGICARCKIDTDKEKVKWREIVRLWEWLGRAEFKLRYNFDNPGAVLFTRFIPPYDRERSVRLHRGIEEDLQKAIGRRRVSGHWWEAHHILAVAEGGGVGCGLEGYETLCLPCHKVETAALRQRLKRKPLQTVPILPGFPAEPLTTLARCG